MNPLPEITWLGALVQKIMGASGHQPAIHYISDAYAAIIAAPDRSLAFRQLMSTVEKMNGLVDEIPSVGARKTAVRVVRAFEELFDPASLSISISEYKSQNAARLQIIEAAISSFEDLKYDTDSLELRKIEIYDEIEALKVQFAKSDDISDASKLLLRSQLDLLASSFARVSIGGVGSFRETVFCVFGRVTLELKADQATNKVGYNEAIDGLLRLYAIAEAGGTILSLTGKVIARLAAPV